jgi:CDP-archaeol synthase
MTRLDPLVCALFLIGAFVLAGLAHSAWLRTAVSRRLAIPLDGGARVRGRRLFGDNKTVRGFAVMIPAAALSFLLLAALVRRTAPDLAGGLWPFTLGQMAALGAWAALGFMLGELPNSFVKRQLDIAPGVAPRAPAARVVSFLIDRYDSILGMLAAVMLVAGLPWAAWAYVVVLGPPIHWSFSVLLHQIGVKARPA